MSELKVNTISEVTGANGVVIDSVKLKDGGVIKGSVIANSNLTISSSAGNDLTFDSNGGNFRYEKSGTEYLRIKRSSGDVVLQPKETDKDLIIQDTSGHEVARFDSSEEALLLDGTNKIMFSGSARYIHSPTDGQIDIVADGSVTFGDDQMTIFSGSAAVHPFVGNDAGATIPTTRTYQRIDANGSARTGMRFQSAGTRGQFLIVDNEGGENVTFDPNAGTALITTNTDNDTMMPGEVFTFISNGTQWFLVGGDLQAG